MRVVQVEPSQIGFGVFATAGRRTFEPGPGLHPVLVDPFASPVENAHFILGGGIPLLRGLPEPACRLGLVLWPAVTIAIEHGQLDLRADHPRSGRLAPPFARAGVVLLLVEVGAEIEQSLRLPRLGGLAEAGEFGEQFIALDCSLARSDTASSAQANEGTARARTDRNTH